MKNNRTVKVGSKYMHYKGKQYLVLNIGKHSETEEDVVIYQQLYGDNGIWVRPMQMFLEEVEIEKGKWAYRFQEIE